MNNDKNTNTSFTHIQIQVQITHKYKYNLPTNTNTTYLQIYKYKLHTYTSTNYTQIQMQLTHKYKYELLTKTNTRTNYTQVPFQIILRYKHKYKLLRILFHWISAGGSGGIALVGMSAVNTTLPRAWIVLSLRLLATLFVKRKKIQIKYRNTNTTLPLTVIVETWLMWLCLQNCNAIICWSFLSTNKSVASLLSQISAAESFQRSTIAFPRCRSRSIG